MANERVIVPANFFRRSAGLSGSGYGTRYAVEASPPLQAAAAATSSCASPREHGPDLVLETSGRVEPERLAEDLDAALQEDERRVDMLLLLAKCSVPALFVAVGGAVAIPADGFLSDAMRTATEEMAGGALLVTYAFELTKGYTLHAPSGEVSIRLVLWSFLGTFLSGQLQAAAQGMWPFPSGGGMGDALPFFIAFFVDGVVLAYDTPPPPTEEELEAAEKVEEERTAAREAMRAAEDEGEAGFSYRRRKTLASTRDDDDDVQRQQEMPVACLHVASAAASAGIASVAENAGGERSSGSHAAVANARGDAEGRAGASQLADNTSNGSRLAARRGCCCWGRHSRRCWRRVSPALSVLTFVVSVDNFVTGLGVYAALDTGQLPAVGYCASHSNQSLSHSNQSPLHLLLFTRPPPQQQHRTQ